MHLSQKMTSMSQLPTFLRWLFVHVYASSFANTNLWMPKMPSPKTYLCSLVTFLHWQSPSPMLPHYKLMVLQASSLVELSLQQIECLCALCANDVIVRTSSLRPSLLTQIGGHRCWHRLKAITLMQTSPSTIFLLFFICHLCLPCFGLACLNLNWNYHFVIAIASFHLIFVFCVFYKKIMHQW
jgi:hypothetical protein